LLGAHVARRGENLAVLGQRRFDAHVLGQAEIDDGQAPGVAEQDVLRLEVAVDDAARVDRVQRLGDLAGDAQGTQRGDALREPRLQVAAGEILHRDVGVLTGETLVEDARHVLVLDRGDQLVLAHEALQEHLVAAQRGIEHLEHQLQPVVRALAQIGLGHAALADHAQHAVTRHQHRVILGRQADLARVDLHGAQERGVGTGAGAVQALRLLLGQRFLDRAHQPFGVQGVLAHEIGRAGLHGLDRQVLAAARREQHHRGRVRVAAYRGDPGDAVRAAGLRVEQHGGIAAARELLARVALGARIPLLAARLGPAGVQHRRQFAARLRGFVDDQETHSRGRKFVVARFAPPSPARTAAAFRCLEAAGVGSSGVRGKVRSRTR
jgi:hypothetical protein